MELLITNLKNYRLTLYKGDAVVRNQSKIFALIGTRISSIPPQYHGLLANGRFIGTALEESIVWETNVFHSSPVPLSNLEGEERAYYEAILTNALACYTQVLAQASDDVRSMLFAAISYHSLEKVFCADGKVVIAEWGMSPVQHTNVVRLPYVVDLQSDVQSASVVSKNEVLTPLEQEFDKDDVAEDDVNAAVEGINEVDAAVDQTNTDMSTSHIGTEPTTAQANLNNKKKQETGNAKFGGLNVDYRPYEERKSAWKKCLWGLSVFALCVLLMGILLDACSSPMKTVLPVSPSIDSTDVVLSEDSLTYVASTRLLLLLTEEGVCMEDFVRDFRAIYKDEKTYVLSNPDEMFNRITLTLPENEREELTQKLPRQFEKYGLEIIPETMYRTSKMSDDPFLQDVDKRWYFDQCEVFDAWDITMGASDIVVAVIDDGFDLNHPELKGKTVNPYNAVLHNTNVFASASGHGTHVASTAVGNANNGEGISGIAPGCRLMPIQVGDAQGNMSTSAVIDAVTYAINQGADVVNMSLGMYFGPQVQFLPKHVQRNMRNNMFLQEERIWNHLFSVAYRKNVTFVLAGGNENIMIGIDPMSRSQYTIKVSAVQPNKTKAQFSNYGDYSSVSAPGVSIFNAVPNNRYVAMDGTSMAAPIVTGGCALLKSKNRNLTPTEMSQILRDTGIPSMSDVGPIVNFAKALSVDARPDDDCDEISKRYQELLAELEQLKREHPDCIMPPDTMVIPEDLTIADLMGKWKSTTSLYNNSEQEVVLYFTFNGTNTGLFEAVEPDGDVFSAPLAVEVRDDVIYINQIRDATSATSSVAYNPYTFELKPDKKRQAEGVGKNKVDKANIIRFKLVKI